MKLKSPSSGETIFGKGIPAIPMINILRAYADAKYLPFIPKWPHIVNLYNLYVKDVESKN